MKDNHSNTAGPDDANHDDVHHRSHGPKNRQPAFDAHCEAVKRLIQRHSWLRGKSGMFMGSIFYKRRWIFTRVDTPDRGASYSRWSVVDPGRLVAFEMPESEIPDFVRYMKNEVGLSAEEIAVAADMPLSTIMSVKL